MSPIAIKKNPTPSPNRAKPLSRTPSTTPTTAPEGGPPILIAIELLDKHPNNPRLGLHAETLAALVEQMKAAGTFDKAHAIKVRRKADGRYEILSGHHRVEAAKLAKLVEVWAFVVEADDEKAYMMLVLANTQEPPSKLEIAIHALGAVDESKEESISSYAAKVGIARENLSRYMKGAHVLIAVRDTIGADNVIRCRDKAEHLARIADAPKEMWAKIAKKLAEAEAKDSGDRWSIKATESFVKKVIEAPKNGAKVPEDVEREKFVALLTAHANAVTAIQKYLHGMPIASLMAALTKLTQEQIAKGKLAPEDLNGLIARRALYTRIAKLKRSLATARDVAPTAKRFNLNVGRLDKALKNAKLSAAEVTKLEETWARAVAHVRTPSPIEKILATSKTGAKAS